MRGRPVRLRGDDHRQSRTLARRPSPAGVLSAGLVPGEVLAGEQRAPAADGEDDAVASDQGRDGLAEGLLLLVLQVARDHADVDGALAERLDAEAAPAA